MALSPELGDEPHWGLLHGSIESQCEFLRRKDGHSILAENICNMQNSEQPQRGSYRYVNVKSVGADQFTAERLHPHQIYEHNDGYEYPLQQRFYDQKSLNSESMPLKAPYQIRDHIYEKHKPFS
jgi:hypothetical protein